MNEYIYQATQNQNFKGAKSIIIVLPDIYGQTNYAIQTCNELAKAFNRPAYLLDYFYKLTGKANNISQSDQSTAHDLMQKMTAADFIEIFNNCVDEIISEQPSLDQISIVGFCFAGRLAYLTGLEPKVTKIVSFYGAGANIPFYNNQSVVECLINKRQADTNLKVLAFYGSQDQSILAEDYGQTKKLMISADINYTEKVYSAPHAYFQPGRSNYNAAAADASWQDLKAFL